MKLISNKISIMITHLQMYFQAGAVAEIRPKQFEFYRIWWKLVEVLMRTQIETVMPLLLNDGQCTIDVMRNNVYTNRKNQDQVR